MGDSSSTKISVKKPELDMQGQKSSLWLVKVPAYVAEKLATAKTGDAVGTLSITADPSKQGKKSINVTLSADTKANDPTAFTLEPLAAADDQELLSFTNDREKNSFTLHGNVTKKLFLKPKDDSKYRQMIRDRGKSALPSKSTHEADMASVLQARASSHIIDFIPPAYAELKRRRLETGGKSAEGSAGGSSGTPVDMDALRSKLFQCFESNSRQSMKDLIAHCKGVQGFTRERELRGLLDHYARYQSKGMYRGFWELKAEYQGNSSADPSTSNSSSTAVSAGATSSSSSKM